MLYYSEGEKVPVYGYRNGRQVLLRKALSGKSPQQLFEEGLGESFSLQSDGSWLLTAYDELTD